MIVLDHGRTCKIIFVFGFTFELEAMSAIYQAAKLIDHA